MKGSLDGLKLSKLKYKYKKREKKKTEEDIQNQWNNVNSLI